MTQISIRLAGSGDRVALIAFIRDHWNPNHIFVRAPEVFDWQYAGPDGRVNMVLAEMGGADERRILGILGFIPAGRFDPALGDRDIMLAVWKVRDDLAPPGLGLRLLKYLQVVLSPRLIAAIGISDIVEPIYRILGYRTGTLTQAALFNPDRIGRTVLARNVPANAAMRSETTGGHALVEIASGADAETRAAIDALGAAGLPAKSWAYLQARFLDHPWYRYALRGVVRGGRLAAVVVWRPVEVEGARILRIVDFVGDDRWLSNAPSLLIPELSRAGAEYVDIVQDGIGPERLRAGGLVGPADHPELVLPGYFAPFEARTVPIKFAYKLFGDAVTPVRLMRADSDQDRPNQSWELDANGGSQ